MQTHTERSRHLSVSLLFGLEPVWRSLIMFECICVGKSEVVAGLRGLSRRSNQAQSGTRLLSKKRHKGVPSIAPQSSALQGDSWVRR